MGSGYRLDEVARRAGVASTTVRLYRSKGLLAAPRVEGRTGWYDDSHLSRLRLIARLQGEGHSLAGIADLLEQWEGGGTLDALLGEGHAIVVDPAELLARFPEGAMTSDLMARAEALGLVQATDDGKVRIPDSRFLETGSTLAELGIPLDVVLDEWEALAGHADEIAERFIAVFEAHLLDAGDADALPATLARLQAAARQILVAALDASVARLGRERLGDLIDSDSDGGGER
jgi:DNA-binding transcriptional MerR regulator